MLRKIGYTIFCLCVGYVIGMRVEWYRQDKRAHQPSLVLGGVHGSTSQSTRVLRPLEQPFQRDPFVIDMGDICLSFKNDIGETTCRPLESQEIPPGMTELIVYQNRYRLPPVGESARP